jgi:galactose mutarotase-like enzyme
MNITLTSENYQITVNTLGAELKSFQNPFGKEFIWNSDPTHWMRSSPLLFPSIGNVRNNKTMINDSEYQMPRHGFCKDLEFNIISSGSNYATFALSSNEATLQSYPYHFELLLTYELQRHKIRMDYQVFNKSDEIMYYHIGAHPGFICPMEAGEALEDYVLEFEKEEHIQSTVYDINNLCFLTSKSYLSLDNSPFLPLFTEIFDNDAIYFQHTTSHAVSLINPATQKGIHLAYPDFSSIAIWTPAGGKAPFLCLEPWNGAAIFEDEDDIFCHKRDIQTLKQNECSSYHLEISLLGY